MAVTRVVVAQAGDNRFITLDTANFPALNTAAGKQALRAALAQVQQQYGRIVTAYVQVVDDAQTVNFTAAGNPMSVPVTVEVRRYVEEWMAEQ